MDYNEVEDLIYFVTKDQLQNEALEKIGRELSFCEMNIVKKCVQSGLSFGIETIFAAAIDVAIESG